MSAVAKCYKMLHVLIIPVHYSPNCHYPPCPVPTQIVVPVWCVPLAYGFTLSYLEFSLWTVHFDQMCYFLLIFCQYQILTNKCDCQSTWVHPTLSTLSMTRYFVSREYASRLFA